MEPKPTEQSYVASTPKDAKKVADIMGLLQLGSMDSGDGTLKITPAPKVEDEAQLKRLGLRRRIEPYVRKEPKIGRNQPCPCNSGKKYKKCCGNPATQKVVA